MQLWRYKISVFVPNPLPPPPTAPVSHLNCAEYIGFNIKVTHHFFVHTNSLVLIKPWKLFDIAHNSPFSLINPTSPKTNPVAFRLLRGATKLLYVTVVPVVYVRCSEK